MKRLLALLLTLAMLLGLCSAGALAEEADGIPAGSRVAFPAPEGWTILQLNPEDDASLAVIKGGEDASAFLFCPYITVMFMPHGTMVLDAREFTDSSEDIEPFSLGGYDWTGYSYESMGMAGISLTSRGDFGTIVVMLVTKPMLGGDDSEPLTLADPDVQEIISGIRVQATVEADWVVFNEDGSVTVQLPGREGYSWGQGGTGNFVLQEGDPFPECEVEEKVGADAYTARITMQGDGVISCSFSLFNDEETAMVAGVSILCRDGKAVSLTDAYLRDGE